jgi:hypothetical protein
MTSTLPRRTAAVTALAVTAFSGAAIAGAVTSASAAQRAHSTLSIRSARSVINPGGGDTISGQLQVWGNLGNAGRRVALFSHAKGSGTGWTKLDVHFTGNNGAVGFQVTPATTTRYQLRFWGNKQIQGSRSGVVAVRVSDTTSLTIAVGSRWIDAGQSDTVTGVLSLDGTALVGDSVNLLGAADGKNTKLANLGSQVTAADGSVSFSVTPTSSSHYVLVFQKTATAAGARSALARIHVKLPSSLSIRARLASKTGQELISGDLRGGGHGLRHRPVTLQERASGSDTWTTVATKKTGKAGGIGFGVAVPSVSEDYQLVFAGGNWFDGCQSGVVTVTVA